MIYRAGGAAYVPFVINTSAGLTDADTLPTGSLIRNGSADGAVTLTVTRLSLGSYIASFTVPSGYDSGDDLAVKIAATVGSVPYGDFKGAGTVETPGIVPGGGTTIEGRVVMGLKVYAGYGDRLADLRVQCLKADLTTTGDPIDTGWSVVNGSTLGAFVWEGTVGDEIPSDAAFLAPYLRLADDSGNEAEFGLRSIPALLDLPGETTGTTGLRRRPHSFILGGVTYYGDCQPYTPKPGETPDPEALNVKGYWLIFANEVPASMVQDAAITEITVRKTSVVIETGPVYIRQIKPFFSGLSTDHVELLAVTYRGES